LRYSISFKPSADGDLDHFSVSDQRIIIGAIHEFLSIDAESESRRRKRLSENSLAPWELRVGDHRVFYEIDEETSVTILAIGVKEHNQLFIRGEKVTL
jgi:mRNA-degrading endonuclease RelE of RelBE toxin-antitoxin system